MTLRAIVVRPIAAIAFCGLLSLFGDTGFPSAASAQTVDEPSVGSISALIHNSADPQVADRVFVMMEALMRTEMRDRDVRRLREMLEEMVTIGESNLARRLTIIGELYDRDPERDEWKSTDAYRQAAALGNSVAKIRLATKLASGDGVEVPDFLAATVLLREVAEGDVFNAAWAYGILGEMYRNAVGPDHDSAKAVGAYRRAADLGDTVATIQLATMLANGDGVEHPNAVEALAMLDRAIAAEDGNLVWALRVSGDTYRNAPAQVRDATKAIEAYRRAADLGDTASMIAVATMLAAGEGVAEPQANEAINILKRVVEIDDSNKMWALRTLGNIYESVAEPDVALARDAYREAADLGDAAAGVHLASMLATGDGSSQRDVAGAIALLEKAVTDGDGVAAWAWSDLGDLYRSAPEPEGDSAKAVNAYRQAAALGSTSAMINLGTMLATGGGAEAPDHDAAIAILRQAIEVGDGNAAWASGVLADLYRNAPEPYRDLPLAVAAYERAVAAGDTVAMVHLASMLAAGEGVDVPDPDAAIGLVERVVAAEDGNLRWALGVLAGIYRAATTDSRNPSKAAAAYSRAADLGDTVAMVHLASMLAAGEGVDADAWRATDLLEHAIAADDGNAAWAREVVVTLYRNPLLPVRDDEKALAHLRILAEAESGLAHLAVGELLSTQLISRQARYEMAESFRAAARILGTGEVTPVVLGINPGALNSLVQVLLSDAGYRPGGIDGIFGRQTANAVTEFCAARQVIACAPFSITGELVTALLVDSDQATQ